VTAVGENVGDSAKYIHKGLTSSDVKDTALGVMMKEAAEILLGLLHRFHEVLRRRAGEHK
jgi:adenylosuccinate lyase